MYLMISVHWVQFLYGSDNFTPYSWAHSNQSLKSEWGHPLLAFKKYLHSIFFSFWHFFQLSNYWWITWNNIYNFLLMFLAFFFMAFFLGGPPTSIYHFFCPSVQMSHTISQEPYIIWSWFLLHICKMMISPGGNKGKKKKKVPKMKNNYIRHAPYLCNSVAYDLNFWYTIVKWWNLQMCFSFF